MSISPRPQVELEKTYNAAADHYDHPAVSFWDRYGRRTVDRLPLVSGMAFNNEPGELKFVASLVQIGLLDPAKFPVAGVETAKKLVDEALGCESRLALT